VLRTPKVFLKLPTLIILLNMLMRLLQLLKVNPLIAFTPMQEDSSMLLIWADKQWQKKLKYHPAKYYLYIPFGTFLILPGYVVHFEGFCLGNVFESENFPKRPWN